MPITKAVVSEHICMAPSPGVLTSHGYLAGTEWTCDECGAVYLLTSEGAASSFWAPLEAASGPAPEPEPEPEIEPTEEP